MGQMFPRLLFYAWTALIIIFEYMSTPDLEKTLIVTMIAIGMFALIEVCIKAANAQS